MVRKRVQLDLHQVLINQPLPFKGANVRATLELDPIKKPWNKAQAIFIGVVREYSELPRETFDNRWVDSGLRVSVSAPGGSTMIPIPIASFTIDTTWELNREKFRSFAPHVDVEAIQTFLSDVERRAPPPRARCGVCVASRPTTDITFFFVEVNGAKEPRRQETGNWTTSAMNVSGYIVYDNDHGRTAILCPPEVDHLRRSWADHERCNTIMVGSTMLLSIYIPHSGRDEEDYIEALETVRAALTEGRKAGAVDFFVGYDLNIEFI